MYWLKLAYHVIIFKLHVNLFSPWYSWQIVELALNNNHSNYMNPPRRGVHDITLCDKVCQWLATGLWFSPGTPVSSTNKTDCHDLAEILLKVALNTINQLMIIFFFNL